jgi:hypothetical protein
MTGSHSLQLRAERYADVSLSLKILICLDQNFSSAGLRQIYRLKTSTDKGIFFLKILGNCDSKGNIRLVRVKAQQVTLITLKSYYFCLSYICCITVMYVFKYKEFLKTDLCFILA